MRKKNTSLISNLDTRWNRSLLQCVGAGTKSRLEILNCATGEHVEISPDIMWGCLCQTSTHESEDHHLHGQEAKAVLQDRQLERSDLHSAVRALCAEPFQDGTF
jgi:hypothetical protein